MELDHPATQERKKDYLDVGSNFSFRPLDLVEELPSAEMSGEELPSVFVIEGVTMYLTPERVGELLRDVASAMGAGGKVIWTFMERDEAGSICFRGESSLISRWLQVRNEPFLWGDFTRRPTRIFGVLRFEAGKLADHEVLRRDYLMNEESVALSLAEGELISTVTSL